MAVSAVAVDTVPPPPDDCNMPFFENEYVEREDEDGKDGWGVLAYVVDRGSMTCPSGPTTGGGGAPSTTLPFASNTG